jgi:hypothetical protein
MAASVPRRGAGSVTSLEELERTLIANTSGVPIQASLDQMTSHFDHPPLTFVEPFQPL